MAITTGQMTVGTVASQIDGTSVSNFKLHIHNLDNTDTLYIGGPNVTINNGLGIQKLESIYLECYPLDAVWVVSQKSGHLISYLKQV